MEPPALQMQLQSMSPTFASAIAEWALSYTTFKGLTEAPFTEIDTYPLSFLAMYGYLLHIFLVH